MEHGTGGTVIACWTYMHS